MHLLFTDETNLEDSTDAEFFIYGGLVVPAVRLKELHDGIAAIRKEAGFQPEDAFKFQVRTRPAHVSIEAFNDAKAKLISLCYRLRCHFIVYVFLKAMKGSTSPADMVAYGANSVLEAFNRYLDQNQSFGVAISDRLAKETQYEHMREKFTKGLSYQNEWKPLANIGVFASSCINASHAASAIDIVLGAFRYCVNSPKNEELARRIMCEVAALIWHTRNGDDIETNGKGLIIRPIHQNIRAEKYKAKQVELVDRLNSLIRDIEVAPPMPAIKGYLATP